MIVVMGATGHVGSVVASALLERGEQITVVTRNIEGAASLIGRGAKVAELDVHDVDALHLVFRSGRRAFLLNPPADVAGDTDAQERETVRCIFAALEGSGLERVVAQSVSGARPGEGIGDLTVLHGLEEGLRGQPIPAAIIRATYYMSNWDAALKPAREQGQVPTIFPADLKIPRVAPLDMGRCAAGLLQGNGGVDEPTVVEGPDRYSSADVAAAFARALGREVTPEVTPRDKIEDAFKGLGFSAAAARSYARMTKVSLDEGFAQTEPPWRGGVTIDAYIGELVASAR